MEASEIGGVPHRAGGDAAVKELGVQIIKETFDNASLPVKRHSFAGEETLTGQ